MSEVELKDVPCNKHICVRDQLESVIKQLRQQLYAAQAEITNQALEAASQASRALKAESDRDDALAIIKKAQEQEPVKGTYWRDGAGVFTSNPLDSDLRLYLHPIPADHSECGKPSLAQQLEFVTAERDGIRKHRDQLLEKLGKAPHWVSINDPADMPDDTEHVLWDGCDLSVDFTDTEVEYGTTFFSNGTEATHYLANLTPPPQSEVKPS